MKIRTDEAEEGQKLGALAETSSVRRLAKKFGGLVTYGDDGEVFLLTDAAHEGKKRRGPSR